MSTEQDVYSMDKIMLAIRTERVRQVTMEGWTPEHDDGHTQGQLLSAASCYVVNSVVEAHLLAKGTSAAEIAQLSAAARMPPSWPWARGWWKPKDRRRNLIRAAALIVAELQRIDREAARQ